MDRVIERVHDSLCTIRYNIGISWCTFGTQFFFFFFLCSFFLIRLTCSMRHVLGIILTGGSGRATLGITLSTASCTHQVIFSELPDDDWSRWTVRALTARSVVRHEERERDDSSPLLAPEYSYAISLDFCSDPIPQAT